MVSSFLFLFFILLLFYLCIFIYKEACIKYGGGGPDFAGVMKYLGIY